MIQAPVRLTGLLLLQVILAAAPVAGPKIQRLAGRTPLRFEPNAGQADPEVRYLARGADYSMLLKGDELVMVFDTAKPPVRMKIAGAMAGAAASAEGLLPSVTNYYLGSDPEKWRPAVPNYAKVRFAQVYPGIDVVYYGNEGKLEFDFVVHPGADPAAIRLRYSGADGTRINRAGDLVLMAGGRELLQKKPVIYQETAAGKVEIAGGYRLIERSGEVTLALGKYDRSKTLVIDPTVVYSTYLGGADLDQGWGVAVDGAGSAYIVGESRGAYPLLNSMQIFGGATDVIVTKLNTSGQIVYSTYLGGPGVDAGYGIAAQTTGEVVLTGSASAGFPLQGAAQFGFGGGTDAFVTKLTAAGTLFYSTYLGGSGLDKGRGVAIESGGIVHVAGSTDGSFPVTNAAQGTFGGGGGDAFVARLSNGGSILYATYLGGSGADQANGVASDGQGGVYVTGFTSGGFPVANAAQGTYGGGNSDGFAAKLNSGGGVVYATYLGGPQQDFGYGIAADSSGSAYIGGTAMAGFPVVNAAQGTFAGGASDAFLTKLGPAGQFVYSTFQGGALIDYGYGVAVDSTGAAYLCGAAGRTGLSGLDTTDGFVTKYSPSGAVRYTQVFSGANVGANFAYGVAVDFFGAAYATGYATGGFPVVNPAQATFGGTLDAIAVKIEAEAQISTARITGVTPTSVATGSGTFTVNLTGTGFISGASISWNGTALTVGSLFSTSATATVPASLLTTAGVASVTLTNPGQTASNAALISVTGSSSGGGVATISLPANNSQLQSTQLFTWNGVGGATGYWLDVGTAAGQGNVCASGLITVTAFSCGSIPSAAGGTIYVQLWTQLAGVWQQPERYTYQAPGAGVAAITSPAPGSQLGASTTFTWSTAAGATGYWLDVGSAPGQGDTCASGQITATSFTCPATPAGGGTIHVQLWTQLGGVWQPPARYTYLPPNLAAVMTSPANGSQLQTVQTFTWGAVSGAAGYWVDVGTNPGEGNVCASGQITATTFTCNNVPPVAGPIYVQLWTRIGGGWQTPQRLTYVAPAGGGQAVAATLTAPAAGTVLTGSSATFEWSAGTLITEYWLDVGTVLGQGNLFGGVLTARSKTVTNLPGGGQTLFVRLWSRKADGSYLQPLDYAFTTSSDARATLLVPGGTDLGSDVVVFGWKAGVGADGYWLDVGPSPGSGAISSGFQTSLGRIVNGLPCTGQPVYARLWTRVGGVFQTPIDYPFTLPTNCPQPNPRALLISPAVGSPLTGSTAFFTWTPGGAGVTQFSLDIGTALGLGDISSGTTSSLQRVVNNLPTNGKPIFVRLTTNVGGVWLSPIDYVF